MLLSEPKTEFLIDHFEAQGVGVHGERWPVRINNR